MDNETYCAVNAQCNKHEKEDSWPKIAIFHSGYRLWIDNENERTFGFAYNFTDRLICKFTHIAESWENNKTGEKGSKTVDNRSDKCISKLLSFIGSLLKLTNR